MRLRDRRVQATYPVRLTCQVDGNPESEVTWYKHEEKINPEGTLKYPSPNFIYLFIPHIF